MVEQFEVLLRGRKNLFDFGKRVLVFFEHQ